ncbi:ParA family protein [Weissella kandleri]|uniref:ParA family protein n=1 Tax=Weissella kandleri TaxID=1616 RepID=UPI00387EA1BA
MAHIIALANQKGGVGKTTTTVNLGAALASHDKRVLIIDADPQGNATSGLGIKKSAIEDEHEIYDVLVRGVKPADVILKTSHDNLEIIPATIRLAGAELELAPVMARETRLKEAIATIEDQYDYILIDNPPSLGLITINTFTAADAVLIPVQAEYYALEGLGQLLSSITQIKSLLNPDLGIEGVLLTMVDGRTNLSNEVEEAVRNYFNEEQVYHTVIPRNVRLSEAPSHGLAIIDYDPKSKGSEVYTKLAEEVLAAHDDI